MARMRQGSTRSQAARRSASSPPARSSASCSSSASSGISSQSPARPYFRSLAIRLMSTVVFPLPAPARIRSGPSVAKTASCCMGFREAKSFRISSLRASRYCFSNSVIMAALYHIHAPDTSMERQIRELTFFPSAISINGISSQRTGGTCARRRAKGTEKRSRTF